MAEWFRSYHGAPTDPKWVVVAKRAGVEVGKVAATWWAIEDYASQHQDRGCAEGFDVEVWATFTGWPEAEVQAIVDAFCGGRKPLISPSDHVLTSWLKRQPLREDDSRERTRRYRERKRAEKAPSGGKKKAPEKTRKRVTQRDATKRNVTHGDAARRNVTPERESTEVTESLNRPETTTSSTSPAGSAPDGAVDPAPGKAWSAVAGEEWERIFGGKAPYGVIGSALKPLIEKHGEAEVMPLWTLYCETMKKEGRSAFASAPHFAQRYGTVKEAGISPPKKGRRREHQTLATQEYGEPEIRKEGTRWGKR